MFENDLTAFYGLDNQRGEQYASIGQSMGNIIGSGLAGPLGGSLLGSLGAYLGNALGSRGLEARRAAAQTKQQWYNNIAEQETQITSSDKMLAARKAIEDMNRRINLYLK